MEPYSITITLDMLPRMANAPSRKGSHWAMIHKETKQIKFLVSCLVGLKKPKKPLKRARLTCFRYSSSAPDYDGLVSGFKRVIDGLVECGVLEDDSLEHIGVPTFHWVKAKKGDGKVVVIVKEVWVDLTSEC